MQLQCPHTCSFSVLQSVPAMSNLVQLCPIRCSVQLDEVNCSELQLAAVNRIPNCQQKWLQWSNCIRPPFNFVPLSLEISTLHANAPIKSHLTWQTVRLEFFISRLRAALIWWNCSIIVIHFSLSVTRVTARRACVRPSQTAPCASAFCRRSPKADTSDTSAVNGVRPASVTWDGWATTTAPLRMWLTLWRSRLALTCRSFEAKLTVRAMARWPDCSPVDARVSRRVQKSGGGERIHYDDWCCRGIGPRSRTRHVQRALRCRCAQLHRRCAHVEAVASRAMYNSSCRAKAARRWRGRLWRLAGGRIAARTAPVASSRSRAAPALRPRAVREHDAQHERRARWPADNREAPAEGHRGRRRLHGVWQNGSI